jgi:hypothetical protein
MFRSKWFRKPRDQKSRSDSRRQAAQERRHARLQLEGLEERVVPSAPTTLAPGSAIVNFSSSTQTQNITVGVVSPGAIVNSGTVTVLLNGASIGTGTVSNNSATVGLTIPAGLATSGSPYTLTEDYSGGANALFANSSANGTLTVHLVPPPSPPSPPSSPSPPPRSALDAAVEVALDTAGLLLLENNPNPQPIFQDVIFGDIRTLIYIYTRQIIVTGGQDASHALLGDLSAALPFAGALADPAIQAGVSLAQSLES